MDYCLVCDGQILMQMTWQNVIHLKKRPKICKSCSARLEELPRQLCKTCSRVTTIDQCMDCKKWVNLYEKNDPLQKNESLYMYNEAIKDIITDWKYRGDYVLGEVFQEAFYTKFNKAFATIKKEAIIVPIPLSDERLAERGFNQAYMLATFVSKNVGQLLGRHHHEKQAKKSRLERMMTVNPFRVIERINKPVILIDDIYTTGRTVRHAAYVLKENGCPNVYSYTLIRG